MKPKVLFLLSLATIMAMSNTTVAQQPAEIVQTPSTIKVYTDTIINNIRSHMEWKFSGGYLEIFIIGQKPISPIKFDNHYVQSAKESGSWYFWDTKDEVYKLYWSGIRFKNILIYNKINKAYQQYNCY
jgi:hypothetical protein